MRDTWLDKLLRAELGRRGEASQLRARQVVSVGDAVHIKVGGQSLVNFSSNDYLGLTRHPRLIEAADRAAREYGVGSGASPLVTGHIPAHASAEAAIAKWKSTAAAVLLPSGYQAAHAAIQTLAGVSAFHLSGVRFLVDKLCHASLFDAIAATGLPLRVFPHNHLGKLQRLLREATPEQIQVVVTESIFSMDGDAADLAGLAELKREFPFVLLLDEAHGSGVYGPDGAGYAAELGLTGIVDVSIVTLSKALGGGGGAVCGSNDFRDAVVNWGRACIYSTGISPVLAAVAETAIDVLRTEPQRQQRLRALARQVRGKLTEAGLKIGPGDSPIIPILLGSEDQAVRGSMFLRERGLLVAAIRPPTVPRGTSRLRVTLSSEHGDQQIDQLIEGVVAITR